MVAIQYIDIKKEILSENDNLANELRARLKEHKAFLINVMASPGAGKTTLLLDTIRRLKDELKIGVIEADIESMVDSEKIEASGATAVQIRTGGDCHIDAPMLKPALDSIGLDAMDLLFLENVGNLVCPAEFDTGASCNIMLLSVPEGDDKPLKYPLMFQVSDLVLINKIDTLEYFDFDFEVAKERILKLNPNAVVLPVSAKTGEGIERVMDWIMEEREKL